VATGATAPTGSVVEFWDGDIYLGSGKLALVSGIYKVTLTTSTLAVGTHSIKARFVGNATYAVSESSIFSQIVA